MIPYWVFRILDEVDPRLPILGRGNLEEVDTMFQWKSIRFWRFILVYRLSD